MSYSSPDPPHEMPTTIGNLVNSSTSEPRVSKDASATTTATTSFGPRRSERWPSPPQLTKNIEAWIKKTRLLIHLYSSDYPDPETHPAITKELEWKGWDIYQTAGGERDRVKLESLRRLCNQLHVFKEAHSIRQSQIIKKREQNPHLNWSEPYINSIDDILQREDYILDDLYPGFAESSQVPLHDHLKTSLSGQSRAHINSSTPTIRTIAPLPFQHASTLNNFEERPLEAFLPWQLSRVFDVPNNRPNPPPDHPMTPSPHAMSPFQNQTDQVFLDSPWNPTKQQHLPVMSSAGDTNYDEQSPDDDRYRDEYPPSFQPPYATPPMSAYHWDGYGRLASPYAPTYFDNAPTAVASYPPMAPMENMVQGYHGQDGLERQGDPYANDGRRHLPPRPIKPTVPEKRG